MSSGRSRTRPTRFHAVSALEPGDVPEPPVLMQPLCETFGLGNRVHGSVRVDERTEVVVSQSPDPVVEAERCADDGGVRRVREDQQTTCVARCCLEQALVVGVAADHPVQHDHVGRRNRLGIGGDVVSAARHPVRHPRSGQQCGGLGLVAGGDLQIGDLARTAAQQLEVQITDATAPISRTDEPSRPPRWAKKSTMDR